MSRGKNEANSNFLKLLILWKLYLCYIHFCLSVRRHSGGLNAHGSACSLALSDCFSLALSTVPRARLPMG